MSRCASLCLAGEWGPASRVAEQLASVCQQHSTEQQAGLPLGLRSGLAALGQWHAAQRGAGPDADVDAEAAFARGGAPASSTSPLLRWVQT